MQNKLLIFDGNSLLNRAYYALPPLNDNSGRNVNAVFGFIKILNKAIEDFKPTHFAVAFDMRGKNFRKDIYPEYKANRHGMPDDLAQQMPILQQLLTKMNVKILQQAGVEADDIIGTVVSRVDADSLVVSGDKDLLQLVSPNVTVILTKKGISEITAVTPLVLLDEFFLTPRQVVEYKALRGDTSDNIPGVKGIGEKTALSLIAQYGDVDGIYAEIDSIKGAVKDRLTEGKDLAYISKTLATIVRDVDIQCNLVDCKLPVYDDAVRQQFTDLKFRTLLTERQFENTQQQSQTPAASVQTEVINTLQGLTELVQILQNSAKVSFCFDGGIWLSDSAQKEFKVEVSDSFLEELTETTAFSALKPLLEGNTSKIVFDSKAARHTLDKYNIDLCNADFDVSLLQYLTEPVSYKTVRDLLAINNLPNVGSGLFVVYGMLFEKLNILNLTNLYTDIELPLASTLYRMEKEGVAVDKQILQQLSQQFKQKIDEISQEIYALAGEEFNIASPKQLSVILFERLNLKHSKKTATGFSTNNDVLEGLLDKHPIIAKVITYRSYAKLYGTYIEGMRPLISGGAVHTTYNQYLTTTGRLSSSEPNMQNIPIRDELGKEVRRMFVSKYGRFVAADYSQIELRLLAGFSGDENLLSAFKSGEDIHKKVAGEIFGVPLQLVTPQMRRTAKAVNFGIIYGQGAFGLSESVGISVAKAKQYIDMYFSRFPGIKAYLDGSIEQVKRDGFVTTFTGRRRYLPEINSTNAHLRSFGERAAMNMPLQGSAADIMKIAMLKAEQQFNKLNLKSKIVLQVHDELVADCFDDEVEIVKEVLKQQMENAVEFNCPLTVEIDEGESLFEV